MLDLLNFDTEEESAYAQSIVREAQTDEVWIGLCLLAGRWSKGLESRAGNCQLVCQMT